MTEESKPTEGSLSPETEPPRRIRKGGRGEDAPKDAAPSAAETEGKESSERPEAAPASKDTKPARRMRFRLIRK